MVRLLGSIAAASILMATAGNAAAPSADQAAKLAEAHAIIDVMFPADHRDAMFAKLQQDMLGQMMPKRAGWMEDPGVKKILDDFIAEASVKTRAVYMKHLPDQLDAMAAAYARTFSLGELKDIDAFAHSPSGRHYFSESLSMIGAPEVAKANSAAVADVRAVLEVMKPELKEKVIAYVKAHPEVAEKITAEGQ